MISPDKTYTLEEFIDAKPSLEITYDLLSIYQLIGETYMITYNILNDYKKEILSVSKLILLDDDEMDKYYQSPSLLSYDIYGSSELDYIILFVNNMYDMKQFTKKNIRLIEPTTLSTILSDIYKANQATLTELRNKIGSTN